jgi:hypothetical protein
MNLEEFNNINQILMEWNPLTVDGTALSDEYTGIIPSIYKVSHSKFLIERLLEDLLKNQYGIDFNRENKAHIDDLENTANRIMLALEKSQSIHDVQTK